jgi:chorismate-pyruvate lyase
MIRAAYARRPSPVASRPSPAANLCDSMVGVAIPSQLERALSRGDGTVTAFLERLVGEPVDAHRTRHQAARAGTSSYLQVEEGHPLLNRTAVLQGRTSGRAYVYAESVLVPSRLSADFRLRLDSTSDPIGRILDDQAITVTRVPLSGPDRADIGGRTGTRPATGDCLLSRSYRIDAGGAPLMVIAEWFLSSLTRYLPVEPE